MKIIIKQVSKCTIEDFADAHDLTMIVEERNALPITEAGFYPKYLASFDKAEDKDDTSSIILASTYGTGTMPDAAISDYAQKISGRVLVFNATSKENRIEIQCPIFIK